MAGCEGTANRRIQELFKNKVRDETANINTSTSTSVATVVLEHSSIISGIQERGTYPLEV